MLLHGFPAHANILQKQTRKGIVMKKTLKIWAAPILCGLFVFACMRFIFFIGYVPSASMEPTIKEGSFIFGKRLHGILEHGEVIIFKQQGAQHVKRIVGIAGDTICINDATKEFSVNSELRNTSRILTVPAGCYFVVGDNIDNSFDSRYWEDPFVKKSNVLAVF